MSSLHNLHKSNNQKLTILMIMIIIIIIIDRLSYDHGVSKLTKCYVSCTQTKCRDC